MMVNKEMLKEPREALTEEPIRPDRISQVTIRPRGDRLEYVCLSYGRPILNLSRKEVIYGGACTIFVLSSAVSRSHLTRILSTRSHH